eukprot:1588359-Pleurochrysis_carterae.AAC.1
MVLTIPRHCLVSPGQTPDQVELKQFPDAFQDSMDQKPYGAMLRGELSYAAPSLEPRSLEDIPPIADAASGSAATRAALRAQVEHENKIKQKAREALVRDYSNRIASILAASMRPKAGVKLRKLQGMHDLTMYPSMYDGVQMLKELKDELLNLHDAYGSDEHERKIELMRDETLPDNCPGQEFADKVNVLIRDHNPYIQVPHTGERLGRLIVKFLPAALAGEGRALLREMTNKNTLGEEGRVVEETVRLVKMAHIAIPVSAATKSFNKKDKRSVVAVAPSRFRSMANGTQPSGGAPYELPDGQWCSKGTCHFNHDQVNPGGHCYRDPRWPGPLPEKVLKNKQQVERIKNARENNAKRLQVANLPICSAIAAGHEPEKVINVN